MEWNVKNALNRDVEREHLNRILKDIRKTIDGLQRSAEQPSQPGQPIQARPPGPVLGTPSSSSTPRTFTLTLTGDVTGSATVGGTNSVIVTTLDPSLVGVGEAPLDSNFYWRAFGEWQAVPYTLLSLSYVEGDGYLHFSDENGWEVQANEQASANIHTIKLEALTTIHGRRAVAADITGVYHPDISVIDDGPKIVGIARQAGNAGDVIEVQTGGLMTEPSWSWSSGAVFVGDGGILTQTAPASGWVVCVGKAIASDTIDINVSLTLIRS